MDLPCLEYAQSLIFLHNPLYIIQLAKFFKPSGQRALINWVQKFPCIHVTQAYKIDKEMYLTLVHKWVVPVKVLSIEVLYYILED